MYDANVTFLLVCGDLALYFATDRTYFRIEQHVFILVNWQSTELRAASAVPRVAHFSVN